MPVQQERGVLDEYAVRVIREVGQADDLEAGAAKCVLIGRVLLDSFGDVERHAPVDADFSDARDVRGGELRGRLFQTPPGGRREPRRGRRGASAAPRRRGASEVVEDPVALAPQQQLAQRLEEVEIPYQLWHGLG